uniref:SPT16 protein n=1 Tax=Catharus ustulatus TaxID=91951 RepID=A0A8C3UNQ0_CATUS
SPLKGKAEWTNQENEMEIKELIPGVVDRGIGTSQNCSAVSKLSSPHKQNPRTSLEDFLLASWIESKLVICYLRLGQPGLALLHSHRSIIENPSHFCNHLRQAACFRCLHRYSEAARSAMVAQCLYVLAEGAGLDTSDLLQLYWQAMTQEALSAEMSFCALYTPFEKEDKADKIKEANKTFAERHPEYVQHIFTDPHGIHVLPEKAESHPGQQYLLTLGFRNREIGKTLEKLVTQKMPIFPGVPTSETFWQNNGKMIMAALAFIGSTKIKVSRGPCARAMEHLHHASLLGQLHRGEEQAQVLRQGMAELATVPHLQRVSQEEDKLVGLDFQLPGSEQAWGTAEMGNGRKIDVLYWVHPGSLTQDKPGVYLRGGMDGKLIFCAGSIQAPWLRTSLGYS